MSKAVEHIHSEGKFNEVLSTYKDTVLVFDFFATWCGPCKAIEPKINQLATRLAAEDARIKFFKINVDELAEVSTKVGVTAMPTFVIYINGQKHGGEIIGANYEKINTQIITAL
ncbi:thioredoxin trx1, partial [Spiromyces aspiralis]